MPDQVAPAGSTAKTPFDEITEFLSLFDRIYLGRVQRATCDQSHLPVVANESLDAS